MSDDAESTAAGQDVSGEPGAAPEPGVRLGRFRIDRQIGRGGMGVVHEAFDTVFERQVALKLLRIDADGPDLAATRVLREARAAVALHHPNVVIVHEVGDIEPTTPRMAITNGGAWISWLDAAHVRAHRVVCR